MKKKSSKKLFKKGMKTKAKNMLTAPKRGGIRL
jgi:hypothetical protein